GILEENTLIEMLEFVSDQVSALGPLPTLRIGNQPYSVLPVMLADAAQFPSGSRAARYLPVLDRLRSVWQSAAATIDWVGKSGSDPGEILVRLLQRDGVASRFAFRPMLGPQIGAVVAAGLTGQSAVVLSERRQRAA